MLLLDEASANFEFYKNNVAYVMEVVKNKNAMTFIFKSLPKHACNQASLDDEINYI